MIATLVDQNALANSADEYRKLVRSDVNWIARTAEDLQTLRSDGAHGLDKLSAEDFAEFVGGLEFAGGGIAGGSYRKLMTLTLTEIGEIFERFGMSHAYARQTQENRCGSNGCEYDFFSFCSSLCVAAATDF